MINDEQRESYNAKRRQRRRCDPDYRNRLNADARKRYYRKLECDKDFREHRNAQQRKYREDADVQERVNRTSREYQRRKNAIQEYKDWRNAKETRRRRACRELVNLRERERRRTLEPAARARRNAQNAKRRQAWWDCYNKSATWTSNDDLKVLQRRPIELIACELGRTYSQVANRRYRLRKRQTDNIAA